MLVCEVVHERARDPQAAEPPVVVPEESEVQGELWVVGELGELPEVRVAGEAAGTEALVERLVEEVVELLCAAGVVERDDAVDEGEAADGSLQEHERLSVVDA